MKRKSISSSISLQYHKTVRDKAAFAKALTEQIQKHSDCEHSLIRAVARPGEKYTDDTIRNWTSRRTAPRWKSSLVLLSRIEKHYGLESGHLKRILFPKSALTDAVRSVNAVQQHVMRWHLPDDFDALSARRQAEIIDWVKSNVLACSTEYGKFLKVVTQKRFSLRFPPSCDARARRKPLARYLLNAGGDDNNPADLIERSRLIDAPPELAREVEELVHFKTTTIAPPGFRRVAAWSTYTAQMRVRHLGMIFGIMVASPNSSVHGLGIDPKLLTMGLLAFPGFWDWLLEWRERRRGFLTIFERHLIQEMIALTRPETGWIRQHPELARKLRPIKGFVTRSKIAMARRNWSRFCDVAYKYFISRSGEVRRVVRGHRDPFEAILVVLNKPRPMSEYRKISVEILRNFPDEKKEPLAAAECVRGYLMLRLAMHLGLRQRNLRELLVCPKGTGQKSTFELESRECGELRWSKTDNGWEVYIPAIAFKNSYSAFFRKGPFRVILPRLENLYAFIDAYLDRHRAALLRGHTDPGTFFVRTLKSDKRSGAYDMPSFYAAWRLIIQRHGIYNPYTKLGAIEGLLPHGPHNVRDVIATHVLKQTGSYELASFAIHDTPEVTRQHYCRFLPEEKSSMAAAVLNKVWRS